jgi:hypothetical protein
MQNEWTVHYRTPNGMVHIADLQSSSRSWCIFRCDPGSTWKTAQGDVDLPATCLLCLAADEKILHTADECDRCKVAMENCPCDTPRCGGGCHASCQD